MTFPSLHAGAAVPLAWGFFNVPYIRWPALVLNGLMFASSIPIGAHYIVDLIAGAAISAGALTVACVLARRYGSQADQDEPLVAPAWWPRGKATALSFAA